jgi:hypothetical protein
VPAEIDALLTSYFAAWNEPDAGVRRALLERVVSLDVEVVPGYRPDADPLVGRGAFDQHVGEVIASRPSSGVRLVMEGGPDHHHDWLRFRWRVVTPDGATFAPEGFEIAGLDVVRVGADGRFDLIVIFFGQ